MKKIHITESQLQYIKKRLTEQGETDEVVVDAHAGASGKLTTQDLTQQYNNAQKHVTNANVAMKVDGTDLKEDVAELEQDVDRDSNEYSDVMEKKIITKKQIKEAKLRNLRENCIRITKKNLK